MADTNLADTSMSGPGANVYIQPPVSVTAAPSSSEEKGQDSQGVSTISKSEKEHILDPGVVWIPPPQMTPADYAAFISAGSTFGASGISGVNFNQAQADLVGQICLTIATNWNKSEQLIAQRVKDEINSPMTRIKEDYKHRLEKQDPSTVSQAPITTAVLMITAASAAAVAGTQMVSNASQISFNIVKDSVAPVLQLMPGDMRAELGLLGTLMMTTLVYQTAVVTIATGGTAKGKNIDMEFAKNFAKVLVNKINNGSIERDIYANVISKLPKGSEMSDDQRGQLNAKAKLMLLFNALALINKVEMGHLTSEEMGDMLNPNGTIKLTANDPRINVIQLIRDNLHLLPPSERAKLLDKLFEYYEGQPSLENLADPAKAYAAIFEDAGKTDNEKILQQKA